MSEPIHSGANIIGYCRACGKALDESSARSADGTIYCEEHVPVPAMTPAAATSEAASSQAGVAQAAASEAGAAAPPGPSAPPPIVPEPPSPYTAPPYHSAHSPYAAGAPGMQPPPIPNRSVSPPLAFMLGLIPGVGAVYNGQYAKGLIHVIVLGLIISILSAGGASGLEPLFGFLIPCFFFYMAFEAYHTARKRQLGEKVDEFSGLMNARGPVSRFPAAPVILIALGVLFLLNNLDLLELRRALRYWPAVLIVAGFYMLYARMAPGSKPPEAKS